MRQETIVKTYLKFNELNESQKTKVISNLHDINTDYNWYEYTLEYAKNLLSILGFYDIKFEFSGFSSQGDGASFTAMLDIPKTLKELENRVNSFKKEAPNEDLFNFLELTFSEEEKDIERAEIYRICRRYSHSNTITSDNEYLKEFARSFSNALYRRLEKEYDYLTSRQAIQETIEANDYDFDSETLKLS